MKKMPQGIERDTIIKHIKWEYEYQQPHGPWASKYELRGKKFKW